MPEYIEREAAIKELMNDAPEQVGYSREDASDCIRYMDAAEVAPVRHGRWICKYDSTYGLTDITCSRCRDTRSIEGCYEGVNGESLWNQENYCPNCGAIMDLED